MELAILRGHVAVKAPKTVDPLDIKGAKENSDVFSSHSLGMQSWLFSVKQSSVLLRGTKVLVKVSFFRGLTKKKTEWEKLSTLFPFKEEVLLKRRLLSWKQGRPQKMRQMIRWHEGEWKKKSFNKGHLRWTIGIFKAMRIFWRKTLLKNGLARKAFHAFY